MLEMFRKPTTRLEPIIETGYSKDDKLKALNSLIESKTDWYGWTSEIAYVQKPTPKVVADVLRVFQKYFPNSKETNHSSVIIEHPEYGYGEVQLYDMKIDEVLSLMDSGIVQKLLIHTDEVGEFDRKLRFEGAKTKGIGNAENHLDIYINFAGAGKLTERQYNRKSPEGPICVELFISPANETTKPLSERIKYELTALRNPVLQNENTEQFLDTSSLFEV